MVLLVEDVAEAVASAYVEVGDPSWLSDRFRDWAERYACERARCGRRRFPHYPERM